MASNSAFLIVQHADLDFQKKTLPVIEKYCKINEADWENYCLMKDRVLMKDGKPQIYGSQVKSTTFTNKFELYEIEDPSNVDKRRKEKGLIPLNEYLTTWNIEFKVPQNK